MRRQTNQELAELFRHILTEGAKKTFEQIAEHLPEDEIVTGEYLLAATKQWRGEMWKVFSAIEDRLDPLRVEERMKREL